MMLHLDIEKRHVSSLESALANHLEPVTLTGELLHHARVCVYLHGHVC